MGIYYFYTWITSRYPLIKKKYDPEIIPQIDHLYLDLNGVLHKCAKANTALFRDLLSKKKMEEIFIEIINYINFITNLIKPKKSIFFSIDGVAPRAKMNNQRHRRFRTSKKQKDLDEFLLKDLKLNPDLINFKNNSISPGTEFMIELNKHIKFFIKKKIKEDFFWKDKKIYLSSGDVPGEGEHKILDFIRGWKQSEDFDKNDTHCIYGNDSDLILLSLITHLENVMLLKEEHIFNNYEIVNSATDRVVEEPKMSVIFVNLLREYLELEFINVLDKKVFDIDRVVDDFVLFSFFIGNDFLHQLYCMNTKYGNFDEFMSILCRFYKNEQKYLTDGFKINWDVWGRLLNEFLHFEQKMIKTTIREFDYKISDLEQNKIYQQLKQDMKEETIENEFDYKLSFKKKETQRTNVRKLTHEESMEISSDDENEKKALDDLIQEEKSKKYLIEFQDQHAKLISAKSIMEKILNKMQKKEDYKSFYYKKYFKFEAENLQENIEKVCEAYINGIDFVFKYYYISCPSWDWYYPYPISPLLTDIYAYIKKKLKNTKDFQYTYPPSTPLLPYQQLLFILPKSSLILLPEKLRNSALDPKNGIARYYPLDFNVIPYDKQKDYTWIPDVEEIDEKRMFEFFEKFDWECLNEEERERNKRGKTILYFYDETSEIEIVPSVEGFVKEMGFVRVEEFELGERFGYDKNKERKEQGFERKFPTFKIYKHYRLIKIKQRKKVVNYLLLTKKSIKNYWEKFNNYFKILKQKKYLPIKIYLNPIFGKTLLATETYNLKRDDSEYHQELKKTVDFQKNNYIILEKTDLFKNLKFMNIFIIESPTFSHLNYTGKKTNIKMKSDYYNGFATSFMNLSLKKNYKSLKEYEDVFKSSFYQNTQTIDLQTGHLYKIKKSFNCFSKNFDEKSYELLVANNFMGNIQVSSGIKDLVLITEKFLKKLDLEKNELIILWLVLDSIKIRTDLSEHNSLILGDAYDVGLNFIHLINKKVENWKIVNDMVKIINTPNSKDEDFSCFYDCPIQKMRKKNHRYSIFLTKEGVEQVLLYFTENKKIINHLKSENKSENLIFLNKYKKKMIKNRFLGTKIFEKTANSGINIKLFNIYSTLLQQNSSTLLLQPSLSLIYPITTIKSKLINFQKETKTLKTLKTPLKLLKNQLYKETVWPALSVKPSYHSLGDRVIFINNFHRHLNFGALGIVIGIYKDFIEVLFDKPFIGQNSLRGRCPNFRGGLVLFFEVFNLTKWSGVVVEHGDREDVKRDVWNGEFSVDGLLKLLRNEQSKVVKQKEYVVEV